MMKIAGCCLVIAATSLWGMDKAKRLKEEIQEMKYMQKIIYLLQSEMNYSKTFLADIFEGMSTKLKEPYGRWLKELHLQLNKYPCESFEETWENSIEKYLYKIKLPEKQKEELKLLGKQLGSVDIQVQMRFLDAYNCNLEYEINEKQTEQKTKTKVYLCLGVMSGMLVSVVML